jgi:cation transport ATPase
MPIEVICPGCKARFRVSDKFAGQKGPCPKCKAQIEIPENGQQEEVVVHGPEAAEAKAGRARKVVRPIARKETKLSPAAIAAVAGAVVAVLLAAWLLRVGIQDKEHFPPWILAAGAVVLAPALALAGYSFLRDAELEPFRGQSLAIRTAICGAVYAALWGVYAVFRSYVFGDADLQLFHYVFLIPPFILVGGLAALASYDLDYGVGVIHYSMYVLVTFLLCLMIGVPLR